jgi:ABC-type uncharacterized transport system involved in gliding motility auxiliary subunit
MNTTTKRKGPETDLLAAIQRQLPATPAPEAVHEEKPAAASAPSAQPKRHAPKKAKEQPQPSRAVKQNIYIQEDDRRMLRELSAWLAGQGVRPSDSLIIRAALRMTKTGGELLNTYRQLAQMDRRFKQPGRVNHEVDREIV